MTNYTEVTVEEREQGTVDYAVESCYKGRNTHDGWERDTWNVDLTFRNEYIISLDYHKGTGHDGCPPELDDVLHCIVMGADCLDYDSFEDWANCMGYDEDSRKAEKIFRDCCTQTREFLDGLCGPNELERLQELFQDY